MWENMGFSRTRRSFCFGISVTLMSAVILCAYFIQFQMQKQVSKYDNFEQMDCSIFERSGYTDMRFQKEAFKTWENFYEPQTEMNMVKRYVNGTLSCFCNNEFDKNGYFGIS